MEKQEINQSKISAEAPTHAYVLWGTGEILGYKMKEAAQKLGIGSTSFKTNLKNRYICKVEVSKISNNVKSYPDTKCQTNINSANYEGTETQTATKK